MACRTSQIRSSYIPRTPLPARRISFRISICLLLETPACPASVPLRRVAQNALLSVIPVARSAPHGARPHLRAHARRRTAASRAQTLSKDHANRISSALQISSRLRISSHPVSSGPQIFSRRQVSPHQTSSCRTCLGRAHQTLLGAAHHRAYLLAVPCRVPHCGLCRRVLGRAPRTCVRLLRAASPVSHTTAAPHAPATDAHRRACQTSSEETFLHETPRARAVRRHETPIVLVAPRRVRYFVLRQTASRAQIHASRNQISSSQSFRVRDPRSRSLCLQSCAPSQKACAAYALCLRLIARKACAHRVLPAAQNTAFATPRVAGPQRICVSLHAPHVPQTPLAFQNSAACAPSSSVLLPRTPVTIPQHGPAAAHSLTQNPAAAWPP